METFDTLQIDNLSSLCALELTDEEKKTFSKDLDNILHYVQRLEEIDTSNVSPCNHVLEEMTLELREDHPQEKTLSVEQLIKNSPDHVGNFIKVPPIIHNS